MACNNPLSVLKATTAILAFTLVNFTLFCQSSINDDKQTYTNSENYFRFTIDKNQWDLSQNTNAENCVALSSKTLPNLKVYVYWFVSANNEPFDPAFFADDISEKYPILGEEYKTITQGKYIVKFYHQNKTGFFSRYYSLTDNKFGYIILAQSTKKEDLDTIETLLNSFESFVPFKTLMQILTFWIASILIGGLIGYFLWQQLSLLYQLLTVKSDVTLSGGKVTPFWKKCYKDTLVGLLLLLLISPTMLVLGWYFLSFQITTKSILIASSACAVSLPIVSLWFRPNINTYFRPPKKTTTQADGGVDDVIDFGTDIISSFWD